MRKARNIIIPLVVAAGAWAQIPPLGPFDPNRRLPNGFEINQASIYGAGYDFKPPTASPGGQGSLLMGAGGSSASVGWYLPNDRSQIYAIYDIGYNANARYSALDGLDQMLRLGMRFKLAPRQILTIDGVMQSTTFGGFIFQTPASTDTLTGTDPLGGAIDGKIPVAPNASAATLAVFGARYRGASGGATFTFLQSPRVEWTFAAHASRLFPTQNDAEVLTVPRAFAGATSGDGSVGISYSVSPLTRISFSGDYLFTGSATYRSHLASGSFGVNHILSRQWFVHAEGGPGELSETRPGVLAPRRIAYHASGGIGANVSTQKFAFTAHRDSLDVFGLGASTTGGDFSWSWHRRDNSWGGSIHGGYERLQGGTVHLVEGWIGSINISRKVTLYSNLVLQLVYTTNTGYAPVGYGNLTGTGVRLAYVWAPPPRLK